jgi:hypothetical protein
MQNIDDLSPVLSVELANSVLYGLFFSKSSDLRLCVLLF